MKKQGDQIAKYNNSQSRLLSYLDDDPVAKIEEDCPQTTTYKQIKKAS